MKRITVILIFLFLFFFGNAQKYLDEITNNACNCIEKIPDTINIEQKKMEFGLCIINASLPYQKQLKKDFDFDLNALDQATGEKMGQFFGLRIATHCPELLKIMTQINNDNEISSEKTVRGIITKIKKDFFVSFSLKDINGKMNKYYWLTFIKTDTDLQENYMSLAGKHVEIKYSVTELFDPRINEYREFKIITDLTVIN